MNIKKLANLFNPLACLKVLKDGLGIISAQNSTLKDRLLTTVLLNTTCVGTAFMGAGILGLINNLAQLPLVVGVYIAGGAILQASAHKLDTINTQLKSSRPH